MQKLANGRTLAAAAWISVFVLGWLMAMETVPMWPAGLFFVFFFAVAFFTSTSMWSDAKKAKQGKDGQETT